VLLLITSLLISSFASSFGISPCYELPFLSIDEGPAVRITYYEECDKSPEVAALELCDEDTEPTIDGLLYFSVVVVVFLRSIDNLLLFFLIILSSF